MEESKSRDQIKIFAEKVDELAEEAMLGHTPRLRSLANEVSLSTWEVEPGEMTDEYEGPLGDKLRASTYPTGRKTFEYESPKGLRKVQVIGQSKPIIADRRTSDLEVVRDRSRQILLLPEGERPSKDISNDLHKVSKRMKLECDVGTVVDKTDATIGSIKRRKSGKEKWRKAGKTNASAT